ncbi:RHS repeat-associated core domain-containing protein [Pseudidiomarina sp. YC-516-91]|uniref:RHS repeat-associated core domain-containing protein n=1 Tax=Pseudidiomarina salilacus TaxID=3384452 RepID=UPI003984E25A
MGLLESEQLSIDGLQFLTDYGYNTAGHRVSAIYPSGRVVGYAPNAYGEPTQVGSYATNASYYANGIVRGYDTPNWLTLWQTLDAQQRLKKREVLGGGVHVVELSYTYDANHNIQSIIDGVNGTHSVTGLSYDGLDRLVAATGHWGHGSFSYDSNGNIVTRQLGSASDTYHYDSAKRLTHISGSTARNFSYDNRGNVISNGQRSFSFNRAGHISGSGGISYRYDGHGRRVAKTVSGSTTYSYYSQAGQLLGTYADGDYTDYYYLGREMVARYSDSTQSDAPGYTGHVEDDDLGLVYMQQRYYDANIGRFYSNDPVGFKASNPMLFNRYAYANNNPYKYVDPDGAEPIPFSRAELADTRALASGQISRGQFASRAASRSVGAGGVLRLTPTGRALSLARMVIGAVFSESDDADDFVEDLKSRSEPDINSSKGKVRTLTDGTTVDEAFDDFPGQVGEASDGSTIKTTNDGTIAHVHSSSTDNGRKTLTVTKPNTRRAIKFREPQIGSRIRR